MEKPNDKPKKVESNTVDEPKLFMVVGKSKFPRPALETFFADVPPAKSSKEGKCPSHLNGLERTSSDRCACFQVAASICQCNKVRVCECVGYSSCSCVSNRSCSCVSNRSSRGVRGCRCAPVH